MMLKIVPARSDTQIQQLIALAHEYLTWVEQSATESFPDLDMPRFFQNHAYHDLAAKFPGKHIPPYGGLWLAYDGETPCGCSALAKLTESIGEMRTLYVRPAHRGKGIARQLVETLLDEAHTIGYTHLRLDTLAFMQGAQAMYRDLGFRDIEDYIGMPPEMRQHMRFLELELQDS